MKDHVTERHLLSSFIEHGKDSFYDTVDIVDTNCFNLPLNQILYSCFENAFQKSDTVDVPTLYASANELGLYEIIESDKNFKYIDSLFRTKIAKQNVRNLAKHLAKLKIIRTYDTTLRNTLDTLSDFTGKEDIDEIISTVESPVFDVSRQIGTIDRSTPALVYEEAKAFLEERMKDPVDCIGIPTGFKIYDDIIGGGLRPKNVNVVCARPKVGKSTFGMTVADYVAKSGIPVIVLDTEMPLEDEITRTLASNSQIKNRLIETGKIDENQYAKLTRILNENYNEEHQTPFYHSDISGKPFNDILSIIRRWIHTKVGVGNSCLIVYDYFKIMSSSHLGKLKEYEAVGYQLQELKDFVSAYDASCLAFIQENREGGVSQSDRISWFASSIAHFREKSEAEIGEDGEKFGNRLLDFEFLRYGEKLDFGDYINFGLKGEFNKLVELQTKGFAKCQEKEGFEINDTDSEIK